jgi:hypothetical protein
MVDAAGDYGFRSVSPRDSALPRDVALVAENDQLLLEQIRRAHATKPLDILMGQMWANFISVAALREVQALGIATVNVAMDDRLPEHWATYRGTRLGSVGLCGGLDLVLTTTKECCLWYAMEGSPALYWPLASTPSVFHESNSGIRDIDVAFIGSRYGVRAQLIGALEDAGIKVHAYGSGWPMGPVAFDKCAEVFGRAKIVLGIGTVGYTDDIYTLKLRDFDGPMSGALYLTHRNPDLLELFTEGEEIACYQTAAECVSQTRRFLADDELRKTIAAAGAARARREHTWRERIAYPLRALGFIQ